ncbi:hypothetical protein [Thiolapillus sp.]|uniref:hypothetical protein n=1 Tax=Thiolapillus sp. TaxID=2017437 RepID=UPI003AF4C93B
MVVQTAKYGGRDVFVGAPSDVPSVNFVSPFAALVTASSQEEVDEVLGIVSRLLGLGCKEFCCVGSKAESLHDQLDLLIEKAGLFDVVTTWHEDAIEGCEYFLFGAGGQSLALYGLISRHPELLDAMVLASQSD